MERSEFLKCLAARPPNRMVLGWVLIWILALGLTWTALADETMNMEATYKAAKSFESSSYPAEKKRGVWQSFLKRYPNNNPHVAEAQGRILYWQGQISGGPPPTAIPSAGCTDLEHDYATATKDFKGYFSPGMMGALPPKDMYCAWKRVAQFAYGCASNPYQEESMENASQLAFKFTYVLVKKCPWEDPVPKQNQPTPLPQPTEKPKNALPLVTGMLLVFCSEPDCQVQVDGEVKGQTTEGEWWSLELSAKRHTVSISKAGFVAHQETIMVLPERDKKLSIELSPEAVAPEPTKATVSTKTTVPAPGQRTKTVNLPGGVDLKLVWIPGGEFMIGCSPGDQACNPQHVENPRKVSLDGFWMGQYEVTQRQWEAVMGINPSYLKACGPDCPVEQVSWDDAQKFLKAAGNGLMLPTETQWEYAARGSTKTALYTGPMTIVSQLNAPELDPISWYAGNSGVSYDSFPCRDAQQMQRPAEKCGTHPVGQKQPNAYGLYDMLGNVWEWCEDWWENYYETGPMHNPRGPGPPGPGAPARHVYRGGSFDRGATEMRVSNRMLGEPEWSNVTLGLRVVQAGQ